LFSLPTDRGEGVELYALLKSTTAATANTTVRISRP
jgi:hypothetical protein